MGGTLYFEGEIPAGNSKVLIVVDSANYPTGIWEGQLTKTEGEVKLTHSDQEMSETRWMHCTAVITDPLATRDNVMGSFLGREPHINYRVYVATAGTRYLLKRLAEEQSETRGLKKRLETERAVLYGALKAMVSSDAADRLEKLFKDFLARLGK